MLILGSMSNRCILFLCFGYSIEYINICPKASFHSSPSLISIISVSVNKSIKPSSVLTSISPPNSFYNLNCIIFFFIIFYCIVINFNIIVKFITIQSKSKHLQKIHKKSIELY